MKYVLIFLFFTAGWGLHAQSQRFIYDDFNRLVEVVYENGVKLKYDYDKLGNRLGYEVVAPSLAVEVKVILDGPYQEEMAVMSDALLKNELLPTQEPYAGLGFDRAGGGGESIDDPQSVFAVEGIDAIVDWVLLELRDKNTPTLILQTRAALLQRDGDVVDTDGQSAVRFENTFWGEYYLAVRHRNHLGIMTAAPLRLQENPVQIDFTQAATLTWGNGAQRNQDNLTRMWSGNVNMDGKVAYSGADSDDEALLNAILGNPENTNGEKSFPIMGYVTGDLNMDGKAVYQGSGSDKYLITTSVVLNPLNPTYDLNMPIIEQLPQEQMN